MSMAVRDRRGIGVNGLGGVLIVPAGGRWYYMMESNQGLQRVVGNIGVPGGRAAIGESQCKAHE